MSTMNRQPDCAYEYTVKRGDSFYLIAHRLGIQLRDLLEAHPDIPPSRLTVGDVLCIPYGSNEQAGNSGSNGNSGSTVCPECPPCPEEPDQPTNPEVPENICPPNRRTVVQQGQTASDLQLRYDLTPKQLQSIFQLFFLPR